MADKGKDEDEDPRLAWMYNFMYKSMRLRPDRWAKMLNTEEYARLVMNFINNRTRDKILTMTVLPTGVLLPAIGFPPAIRNKGAYFIKKDFEPITKDNIRERLSFGDLSPKPIEQLTILFNEVISPVFANKANHKAGSPQLIIDEIISRTHDMKNTVSEIRGKITGQTVLSMPLRIERIDKAVKEFIDSDGEFVDVHMKGAVENIIVKWVSQINAFLSEESSKVVHDLAYPTPTEELKFWEKRVKNVECVYYQLKDTRVQKMGTLLELTKSAYYSSYMDMFTKVVSALNEAREIYVYLKPLMKHVEKITSMDFNEVGPLLRPMMHVVCLIWANSQHHRADPSKLITLLKSICNMLIEETMKFLDPSAIFQRDVNECLIDVCACLDILEDFVKIFEECKLNISQYFKGNTEPVPWAFHTKIVFERMNNFLNRLKNIKTLFEGTEEFLRLERIEFGGIKGRRLSTRVVTMLQEFNDMYNVFRGVTYDPLDPDDLGFEKDYTMFREKVADMDRRLATVFNEGLEDCTNEESFFKCRDIISTLAERPAISKEVSPNYKMILNMLDNSLDIVKEIYDEQLSSAERLGYMRVDVYYPPVAGALQWIHKIDQRITIQIEKFNFMNDPVNETAEAKNIAEKYAELMHLLGTLEKKIFSKWVSEVPKICRKHLDKTLLVISEEKFLELNFNEKLVAVLREVRYLTLMEKEGIPREALELFSRNETLRMWICALNIVIYKYNTIVEKSLDIELNLILDEIKSIDELIESIQSELTWNSEDAWKSIRRLKRLVEHLYSRLTKVQSNLAHITEIINTWKEAPLYDRKDRKPENLMYLDDRPERVQKRYSEVRQVGIEVHKLMEDSYKLLFETPPPPEETDSEEMIEEAEVEKEDHDDDDDDDDDADDHIDEEAEVVKEEEEMKKDDMTEELEAKSAPDIEILVDEVEKTSVEGGTVTGDEEMEAGHPPVEAEPQTGASFDPEFLERLQKLALGRESEWSDYVMHVDGLVSDGIYNAIVCSYEVFLSETSDVQFPLFEIKLHLEVPNIVFHPSLKKDDQEGFYALVHSLLMDILKMASLIDRVDKDSPDLNYMNYMAEHGELKENETEVMSRVELAMRVASEYADTFNKHSYLWFDNRKELLDQFVTYGRYLTQEDLDALAKDGLKETKPTNAMFKEKIDHYIQLHSELSKIEEFKLVDRWLKIDVSPLKQGILNEVDKWTNMFLQYLYDHVLNSLNELEEFTVEADREMTKPIAEGDYDGLLKVMSYLFRVRERQPTTDDMFEPLKATIDMLKPYNVKFPEDVILQLQDLPQKWNNTKKIAVTVRQSVAPLMSAEVTKIRKRIILLDTMQTQFREYFRKQEFFQLDCKNVYSLMDSVQAEMTALEDKMSSVINQASLFETTVPEFKLMAVCRKELIMLKELWDYIIIIQSNIDTWTNTQWRNIDVEALDMECKKFGREIRGLDRAVRSWDLYIALEASIKNLLTSLRAVTELQNPAIRDRHWQQLMEATKVSFVMDDETTLSDLLALNLHNYQDEVSDIVDKSVKEMSMEKVLKELQATWSVMEFQYEKHPRTGLTLLKVSDEAIEILEENQVNLQNMLGSRYIDLFLKEVSEWQRKLANADQVLQLWFKVQRTWMHLESIFIGSADIRVQLPQQSKLFEKIDQEFRALLASMLETPNIVEATNKPRVYERLLQIEEQLSVCEKALAEYLETKRLAYPRFYFISSVDLLDILSNGNQPELVARHLTKLYDSLARLRFVSNSKTADAMWSKDGEFVKLFRNCECVGNVETWLNRVTDTMRYTVRMYFAEAVESYEDSVREEWIFDYPAQAALCGTQIWWTTEVNIAFSRLGEGHEYALRDYQRKQIHQLNMLISLLLGDLTAGDRQKIMTICTIDVHSRDVVAKMMQLRVTSSSDFQWQCQLRHRWNSRLQHCFCNICDAKFKYQYEYLGNTPRLVITPLTDRCYITLTQSLHLVMGGAPAGPAGTGKTETTKDLGRAMGVMVYVFNCSEQMDYKSCGNIYKGLAQTGAWGCFDEFNRIAVEVLSVVAVQVKSVLDAIKMKRKKFNFMGEIISIIPVVGMFITMNPGYAGRTELPENLKALFRPCAMVVPDFALICEIMLVAEGFQEARLLARRFITLYMLCRELLSKQDHYDWGLRAIKSVLVVAGALKRGDRGRPEDQVLMRALRDFNIPKIVTDDLPVFMGLIGDLFPALDVPRKRDLDFEAVVKQSVLDLKLQAEDNFVLKIVQLEELLAVRHSVFIVGNAGTGKTMVWQCLYRTYQNQKRRPVYNDLNPKAVTNNELFGYVHPTSREWMDGLISIILRNQANMANNSPKWIVLDGDIDPMWIESLNTVMDDNKVLTLASNERIALTREMRLIFEIASLRTATPATVSRAGILYINPQDLGWGPYVTSWIETRDEEAERANLTVLFDKYIPGCLDVLKGVRFKRITPIAEICHMRMLCQLLDCLLTPVNVPRECPNEWYEIYFVFSCVWSFGSALFQDELVDYRSEFSKWWVNEFKVVKFPSQGTVFDYYVEKETKQFLPWTNLVEQFTLDYEIPLQSTLVSTAETTRIRYFMDLFLEVNLPVMLVGNAGTGKSVLVAEKLSKLSEDYAITNVPFNFYTTSEMLQKVLEKPLEKKAGRNFGPPGNKTMIYFIDDMNMPEVDLYGTVQPHTLIRQYIDYGHWYDRETLTLKNIHNCQFVSCMNPTAGSFTINPRLQRHFSVFALSFPSREPLTRIYKSVLTEHLENPTLKIPVTVQNTCDKIIDVALTLHSKVAHGFLPTAVKFHYTFNLRDLSNIFQGMLFAGESCLRTPWNILRLWMHEANRVYGDKFVDTEDVNSFKAMLKDCVQKAGFENLNEEVVFEEPLIFCHFAEGIGDSKYMPLNDWAMLNKLLLEAMSQYNDLIGAMNLVLFSDAMLHICRITRILESPRGNALLVGVGGSGKQSLSRLASFICNLEVSQIQLRKGYSLVDLKADISQLYLKSGLKGLGNVFLMTDAQVDEEIFLVLINDMLASGEIPELFPDDEVDNIVGAVRNEVKSMGIVDSKENCWKFFIDRVRRQLKVVLCFSPVGNTLRVRGRKFPAIINCTSIDWFHEWPQTALESVSKRFLEEIEVLPREILISVSYFMAYVHTSVNEMSEMYLMNERRYNYTTPKSFLELISLYSKLLTERTDELKSRIERLVNGLERLHSTSKDIEEMKVKLADQEVVVREKSEAASKLVEVLSIETEKVSAEKAFAAEEEAKVRVIEEDVSVKQQVCEQDLARAEPALIAAEEALSTLNKDNLTELRSFGAPPPPVVNVVAAVMILFSPKGKIPKDLSWKACKVFMGRVVEFLHNLKTYDKENIPQNVYDRVKQFLKDPNFSPEFVQRQSNAAAGLCAWVINVLRFYDIYVIVEPKRRALNQANKDLASARERLQFLNDKINSLEEQLSILQKNFDDATEEKLKIQAEADKTAMTIDIANRLVGGLASENVRWSQNVVEFRKSNITLPGDILLLTAFLSYVGCFSRRYRMELLNNRWLPFLKTLTPAIPMTEGLDLLTLLTDDAQIAEWNNEGLPSDRMSTENATILVNSARWPLIIDPQLQGIKWIKNKYGNELKVIRLGQKHYLDIIETAVFEGTTVLIENIGETVEAVLDPLLSRALIKKGTAVKIGDKEVDFNPKFRLILHTKLANPHYKPEMQAQTTLINFTVTRDGLEEQLLAEVVKSERPELESKKTELTKLQNDFKITLKVLEDDLLHRLSTAGGNILEDIDLVTNLETTKKTAAEVEIKVAESRIMGKEIDVAREQYRPAAGRASLLYFVLNDLHMINPMYQFSLKAFSVVFQNAIDLAIQSDDEKIRLSNLIDSITYFVFMYTSRGLFERDKLIFLAQMSFQILLHSEDIKSSELDFLLRCPSIPNLTSPVNFLSDAAWGSIMALSTMSDFRNLDRDIEGTAKRWRALVDMETPENEKLPQDWKNKTPLQQLCIMRIIRPDRMTYAVRNFVEVSLGTKYVESRPVDFAKSYEETSSSTPVFFILSPGVDPLTDVEAHGKKLGFTMDKKNFHNVSLGQGQEVVAEAAMDVASQKGHWVILQNVHLVQKWLPTLDKKLEECSEGAHEDYRLFISAEPAADPAFHIIPQGVLESSIKITNEPPTGMKANLHKALDCFTQETLEMCSKETEFKSILFSLCYFHAVVAERRKFGAQGWNRVYPFNIGDLTICVNVLYNYLEKSSQVPWDDLRYLFGEIMYGGHITDDWDRRLCRTFLEEYMQPTLLDGELSFAAGFQSPPNLDYKGYHNYIDYIPPESPHLYGLHPNAEIGFLTSTSENLFRTVFEMQPRDVGEAGADTVSKDEKVKQLLEEILDKIPEPFNMAEIMAKVEERTPYIVVAFQECERMNTLTVEMRRSLKELELGLKGELTITPDMEKLMESLFMDAVPDNWTARAYPSMLTLGPWIVDLSARIKELEAWSGDFSLPNTIWLAGFFNPQSFLTAIMQSTARKNEWPLDRMCLSCDVTRKQKDEFTSPPREGAYVHGMFMEGARWDSNAGGIVDAKLKELFPQMPVIFIKAITQDKQDLRNIYECPVYKTRLRGPTFVWTFNLKTKQKAAKWTLAGVALLLQI